MTIYLSTNPDGGNIEGIGVMVQSQLFTKALSQLFNCNYIFRGFKNFTHYQYFDITQERFMDDINHLFNLYENETVRPEKISVSSEDEFKKFVSRQSDSNLELELDPGLVTKLGQQHLEEFEKHGFIKQIKNKFNLKQENKKDDFIIAVHIRKFTKTDLDPSPFRDYFSKEKEDYYLNLVDGLRETYKSKNPKFQIYSQGSIEDFNFLKAEDTSFFIEEYPLDSFEKMLYSDVFIMANSSLSYIVHLLRDKITYCKTGFYHKTYENLKMFIGYDGLI